jgi:Rap1a immunity proteins
MRPLCWVCCGVLAVLILAIAAFIVWTIAAINPLWKAEDVGSAKFTLPSCKLTPVQAFINPTAAYLHGRCVGTLESILLVTEVPAQQDPSLCAKIPVGTTLGQIREVVAKYAEEHPDQTNNDFRRFALNAVHEAWPCK